MTGISRPGGVSGAGIFGPYADTTALQAAKPAASNPGSFAYVGASAPYAQYVSNGSAWVATGGSSYDPHGATGKTTPVDADEIPLQDSASSFALAKLTWANLKATLKAYFDTLYATVTSGLLTLGANATTAGKVKLFGSTSGDATIQTAAAAGTATVITLPAVTATLATLGANTFTGQQANSLNGAASTPASLWSGSLFTGGSATTTKPLLLVEPAGTTSTGWDPAGTAIGVNANSAFTGFLIDLQSIGARMFGVTTLGGGGYAQIVSGSMYASNHPGINVFTLGAGQVFGWSSSNAANSGSADTMLRRAAAATLQLGAADAASPVAQTLRTQGPRGGTDSNTAGATFKIYTGPSTGNATPASVVIQSTVAGSSGTTAQTPLDTFVVQGGLIKPPQFTTAGAPAAVLGAMYFDTTLNKLRIGGAGPAWETVTSV